MSGDVLLKRKASVFGNHARFIGGSIKSLIFLLSWGAHFSAELCDRLRKLRGALVLASKAFFLFTAHVLVVEIQLILRSSA
jgi:hypothetical protein